MFHIPAYAKRAAVIRSGTWIDSKSILAIRRHEESVDESNPALLVSFGAEPHRPKSLDAQPRGRRPFAVSDNRKYLGVPS